MAVLKRPVVVLASAYQPDGRVAFSRGVAKKRINADSGVFRALRVSMEGIGTDRRIVITDETVDICIVKQRTCANGRVAAASCIAKERIETDGRVG